MNPDPDLPHAKNKTEGGPSIIYIPEKKGVVSKIKKKKKNARIMS